MADKASTLTLKVDLECDLCYKKIIKTLCKLQDQENILTVAYDEKNSTVSLSGPFDPVRLTAKLMRKASEVIKGIQIVKGKSEEDNSSKVSKPANTSAKKEKEREKAKNEKQKGKSKTKSAPEPAKSNSETTLDQPEKETEESKSQPDPRPKQKESSKPNLMVQAPGVFYPSDQTIWQGGLGCYCRPYQERLYWGVCNYCGRGYGPGQKSYSSEEDPTSCIVM